jgi:hypothetical protein
MRRASVSSDHPPSCQLVVGRLLGHLCLDVAQPPLDAADRACPRQHLGQHRATLRLCDLLAQVADRQVLAPCDDADIGLLVAGDDLQQGRLAGPVRSYDGDAAPGADLQPDPVEQVLGAMALGDPGEGDQAHR